MPVFVDEDEREHSQHRPYDNRSDGIPYFSASDACEPYTHQCDDDSQ
jgi:hypothetical protein